MAASYNGHAQVQALREAIAHRLKSLGSDATNADATKKDAADALKALDDQAKDIGDGKPEDLGLGPLNRELGRLAFMIESGDSRPASARSRCRAILSATGQAPDPVARPQSTEDSGGERRLAEAQPGTAAGRRQHSLHSEVRKIAFRNGIGRSPFPRILWNHGVRGGLPPKSLRNKDLYVKYSGIRS